MLENESKKCNCKKLKCARHGKCSECLEYHNNSKSLPLPYCRRQKKGIVKKYI